MFIAALPINTDLELLIGYNTTSSTGIRTYNEISASHPALDGGVFGDDVHGSSGTESVTWLSAAGIPSGTQIAICMRASTISPTNTAGAVITYRVRVRGVQVQAASVKSNASSLYYSITVPGARCDPGTKGYLATYTWTAAVASTARAEAPTAADAAAQQQDVADAAAANNAIAAAGDMAAGTDTPQLQQAETTAATASSPSDGTPAATGSAATVAGDTPATSGNANDTGSSGAKSSVLRTALPAALAAGAVVAVAAATVYVVKRRRLAGGKVLPM